MSKAFNDFQFKAEKDLRSASEGEPRELWNILNNLNKSTSKRDEIDLDNLYEYFKNLNIDKHPDDDDDEFILPNCDDDFCENAFKLLGEALISPPLLAYPDFDKPFQLYTDASSFALGAVLCQTQNGTERVICYSGRSLSKQEQQYGITEKECLALVYAVKKFDCYLRFTKFTAYVDHSALKWLLTLKEPTGKFARWIALLQSYSMEILYRPGTTHGNADGVSRREYDNVTDQDMESLIDILPYGAVIDKTGNNVKIVKKHSPFVRNITDNDNIEIDNTTKESVNMFPMAQLKVEQRKDTYFKNIITFLESGKLPENSKWRRNILTLQPFYFINDGILYHVNKKYKRHCKDTEVTIQIAVPRKLVPVVLKETHDGLLSGHLGINRTIQRTQRSFFWPSNWI
ncbi:Hypothetical predicted protein [Mytilus galloprovincialis]|uniref:Reverse transcriptase RNase H-like domain-containing protein n=1 Tax=Mytilus galloprovincialis TaxID=29158 RepID=A0A8B6BP66_MYTGA|nr:Hypothetical predicted protein [Mytilus galloprovincialis]